MKKCANLVCSVEFSSVGNYRKKFCSQSCAAVVNNRGKNRHNTGASTCGGCGKKIENGKLYHKTCQSQYRVNQWLSGEWDGSTAVGLSSTLRNYLLQEAKFRCTSITCCVQGGWSGINPKSGKSCLTINHIDGDSQNNEKSNLEVICPNCHSMTPNYGALNKGNGRKNRYK